MSKKLYATVSEENYSYIKEAIGFENWDSKLNVIIEQMRNKNAGYNN